MSGLTVKAAMTTLMVPEKYNLNKYIYKEVECSRVKKRDPGKGDALRERKKEKGLPD